MKLPLDQEPESGQQQCTHRVQTPLLLLVAALFLANVIIWQLGLSRPKGHFDFGVMRLSYTNFFIIQSILSLMLWDASRKLLEKHLLFRWKLPWLIAAFALLGVLLLLLPAPLLDEQLRRSGNVFWADTLLSIPVIGLVLTQLLAALLTLGKNDRLNKRD